MPSVRASRKYHARAAIFPDRRPPMTCTPFWALTVPRVPACKTGSRGSLTRTPRRAAGTRWSSCWRRRYASSPPPGTTRRPRSRIERPTAPGRRLPSWADAATRGPGRSARRASGRSAASSPTSARNPSMTRCADTSPPCRQALRVPCRRRAGTCGSSAAQPPGPASPSCPACCRRPPRTARRSATRPDGSQVHLLSTFHTHGPLRAQRNRLRHHQPARGPRRPRHLAIYARQHWSIENHEHVRSPRRHLPRGRPESQNRQPAHRLRRHPQPRHRRCTQDRLREHKPHPPPLPRTRRQAHPRPLWIRKQARLGRLLGNTFQPLLGELRGAVQTTLGESRASTSNTFVSAPMS